MHNIFHENARGGSLSRDVRDHVRASAERSEALVTLRTETVVAGDLLVCFRKFRVVNAQLKLRRVSRSLSRCAFAAITRDPEEVASCVERHHESHPRSSQFHRRVMQKSEGADARSGVAIGESESRGLRLGLGLRFGEASASADEAIADDEGVVVVEASFRGETTESAG